MKARFGAFEFDTGTGDLRRGGDPVRLQAQPAQVLALLVEHAGEVVSRETIRETVWRGDTFVDFDKGLNFAIAQVRAALGDSADVPTYIRTLPKRGYQFIAPVDAVPVAPAAKGPSGARPVIVGAALIVAVLAAAGVWWRVSGSGGASTIAVIGFDNETGDAALDQYAQNITDAVVAELTTAGGGRVGVIGNAAVLRVPRPARDLAAIGRELRARYIVFGQVQRDAGRLRILAHLIRLPEQKHLWVVRVDEGPDEPPVAAATAAQQISHELLRKL
jgi:DNA-binding winged helix-turn-helix (wHTH) protein/TolB-like protein